jgi:pimeloyl-ACP methyl ester carboxylesterase
MPNRLVDELAAIDGHAQALGVSSPLVRRVNAEVDGVRVSALRWGQAPPEFVFLHGAQLNAYTWNSALLRLGRPALAIDIPGHGLSDRLADADYRASTLARLVAGALARWNVQEMHLVAHSFGSFVAGILVRDTPGIARLTVLDATPARMGSGPDERPHSGTLEQLVASVRGTSPGRDVRALQRSVLFNTRERPDGLREWLWDDRVGDAAERRGQEKEQVWQGLADFSGPLALLRGERGGIDAQAIAEFSARVPRAEIVSVAGAGHNLHSDAAPWLAEWLRERSPVHP